MLIAKVQNICNLIVRKEYNIGRMVLEASVLHSLKKHQQHSNFTGKKLKFITQK